MASRDRVVVPDLQGTALTQVVAHPTDQYIAPKAPVKLPAPQENLGAQQMVQALGQLSGAASGVADTAAQYQMKQGASIVAKRAADSRQAFSDLVKSGQLTAGLNPWQQHGAQKIMATLAVQDFQNTLVDQYYKTGAYNKDDITDFARQHMSNYVDLMGSTGVMPSDTFMQDFLPSAYNAVGSLQSSHMSQLITRREKMVTDMSKASVVSGLDALYTKYDSGDYAKEAEVLLASQKKTLTEFQYNAALDKKKSELLQADLKVHAQEISGLMSNVNFDGRNGSEINKAVMETLIDYAKSRGKDGIPILEMAKDIKAGTGSLYSIGDNGSKIRDAIYSINKGVKDAELQSLQIYDQQKNLDSQVAAMRLLQYVKDNGRPPENLQGITEGLTHLDAMSVHSLDQARISLQKPSDDALAAQQTATYAQFLRRRGQYTADEILQANLTNEQRTSLLEKQAFFQNSPFKGDPERVVTNVVKEWKTDGWNVPNPGAVNFRVWDGSKEVPLHQYAAQIQLQMQDEAAARYAAWEKGYTDRQQTPSYEDSQAFQKQLETDLRSKYAPMLDPKAILQKTQEANQVRIKQSEFRQQVKEQDIQRTNVPPIVPKPINNLKVPPPTFHFKIQNNGQVKTYTHADIPNLLNDPVTAQALITEFKASNGDKGVLATWKKRNGWTDAQLIDNIRKNLSTKVKK